MPPILTSLKYKIWYKELFDFSVYIYFSERSAHYGERMSNLIAGTMATSMEELLNGRFSNPLVAPEPSENKIKIKERFDDYIKDYNEAKEQEGGDLTIFNYSKNKIAMDREKKDFRIIVGNAIRDLKGVVRNI